MKDVARRTANGARGVGAIHREKGLTARPLQNEIPVQTDWYDVLAGERALCRGAVDTTSNCSCSAH
jgi:hypothetical protein